jgi:hypothetical protein
MVVAAHRGPEAAGLVRDLLRDLLLPRALGEGR